MKTKKLPGGYVRLTPNKGKKLVHTFSGQSYSEAVVKEDKVGEFKEL